MTADMQLRFLRLVASPQNSFEIQSTKQATFLGFSSNSILRTYECVYYLRGFIIASFLFDLSYRESSFTNDEAERLVS